MPTIPWTAPKPAVSMQADTEVVVMASRFDLHSLRHVPAFLLGAMRIRRQMLRSPGVLGVSLIAKPLYKTFFTAWQDRAALDAVVMQQPHADMMGHLHHKMAGSRFVFWTVPQSGLPVSWAEALTQLDSAPPLSKVAAG